MRAGTTRPSTHRTPIIKSVAGGLASVSHQIPTTIRWGPQAFLRFPQEEIEPGKESEIRFENAPFFSLKDVQNEPLVEWEPSTSSREDDMYTVVMTDPDAPSANDPRMAEWCHWIRVNMTGNRSVSGSLAENAVPYMPPSPPRGSGVHRYCVALFQQPSGKRLKNLRETRRLEEEGGSKARAHWSLKEFAERHGLGLPVAFTVFQCEPHEEREK
eukprot:gb/GECH01002446.1/.p1 GENE.gb/GECH01002446.1/~~gb/GECH01002446.1/.p1  ORF type:complete len:214 (+),score=53.57 gb/GECH01002446.1/:1-642(+)